MKKKKARPTPDEFLELCKCYPPIEVVIKIAPFVQDLREQIKDALKKAMYTKPGLLEDVTMSRWDWICLNTRERPGQMLYDLTIAAERNLRRLDPGMGSTQSRAS